jgi:hypothetical protein
MPGVWTEAEDDILRKRDAHAMAELDEKHGDGASANRLVLLELWKSTSAEIQRREREGSFDDDQ